MLPGSKTIIYVFLDVLFSTSSNNCVFEIQRISEMCSFLIVPTVASWFALLPRCFCSLCHSVGHDIKC